MVLSAAASAKESLSKSIDASEAGTMRPWLEAYPDKEKAHLLICGFTDGVFVPAFLTFKKSLKKDEGALSPIGTYQGERLKGVGGQPRGGQAGVGACL